MFKAMMVDKKQDDFQISIQELPLDDLPSGDVLIEVKYSSVNYKDGLACIPDGKIVRSYPFVPGIDLAGVVASSESADFKKGDEVIVTSYEQGVSHFGGFSEYARVPADWIVPLPKNLSLKESMIFGTAGFTAALCVQALEESGVTPDDGPVLVTGATGGVGSMAVAMLAKLGYNVVASTGKETEYDYLKKLGASEILSREELSPERIRPLDKERWSGVIDSVGGDILSYALTTTKYGGVLAACGNAAGVKVETTVFPFILRGIKLIGIDSVYCEMDSRRNVWNRLASDLKPEHLTDFIYSEIMLEELPQRVTEILEGNVRGRNLVKI